MNRLDWSTRKGAYLLANRALVGKTREGGWRAIVFACPAFNGAVSCTTDLTSALAWAENLVRQHCI